MNQFQEVFDRLSANAPAMAATDAEERVRRILALYRSAYELRAEVGRAGLEEVNFDGRGQLIPLKAEVDHLASRLGSWMADVEVEHVPELLGRRGFVHQEPKGVVLHLSTWNAPFLISLQPVISAIAAGNVVVLKPSEIAPLAAEVIVNIVENAGLDDQVAVVTGGPEVAQSLLELPFNHVCYVGNNRIGRLVMEAAAANFAAVTLEMGGKNPVVVDGEDDLADAARRIVDGRHMIAGQACLCPDYVLVRKDVEDDFVGCLVEAITDFYDPSGSGPERSADLPRIINTSHARRIQALIDDAIDKGATAVIGGWVDVESRFVAPTVLVGVTEDMDIFEEEVFGPVLTVQGFADRAEAVREIERRPKPLALYVFSSDPTTAQWYIDNTRAGSTAVNCAVVQATVPGLPFGGANHSGIGRLGGKAGFLEFSNPRAVVVDEPRAADRAQQFFPPMPPGAADMIEPLLVPSDR